MEILYYWEKYGTKGKEGYSLICQKGNQIRDPEVALST
jgi:hypothetical protein